MIPERFCDSEYDLPVTYIGEAAFKNNRLISSVSFGSNISKIEKYAFYNSGLTGELVIPKSVTSIGERAFENSPYLKNITLPGTLVDIESYVFQGCQGIESIVLESGIKNIGSCAFAGNISLKTVYIPNTVKTIGRHAFSECDIETVYFEGSESEWKAMTVDIGNNGLLNAEINYKTERVIAGDVDNDNNVTSADAVYLLYSILFGDEAYPLNQNADFDGDGSSNSGDAIYLLYHVLFGNDYPLK